MERSRKKTIESRQTTTIFVFISAVIFFIGAMFVVINVYSDNRTLERNLKTKGEELRAAYDLTLTLTYRNMMQLAIFISNDPEIAEFFKKGKEAVEAEGGGKGGEQANLYRQKLLSHLAPSWEKLTRDHDVRQLHFHLGPGSLSYLRVHRPQKYGDRMDDLRYTIVDTNAEQASRIGFETGRVYSGLRAIIPFFAQSPGNERTEHIGALEVGTSFANIMHLFRDGLDAEQVAVLLKSKHVEDAMWPEAISRLFPANRKLANHYVEAVSQPKLLSLLSNPAIPSELDELTTRIIKHDDDYYALTMFPLYDYRNSKSGDNSAGLVLLANNINDQIHANTESLNHNLIFAIIGFIIIETLVYLAIQFTTRKLRNTINAKLAHIEELNTHLAKQAVTDGLTKLYNHRFFIERLGEEAGKAKRSGRPLSLIMLDIDHFKQVNDTYGHQAGDRVLEILADTLKAQLRTGDEIGRYGGEEFAMALTSTHIYEAKILAQRILQAVRDLHITLPNDREIRITASMGIAQWDSIEEIALLIERADQALYKAKHGGRDCYVEAEDEINAET